jgi:sugar lactone lactonase YvrE
VRVCSIGRDANVLIKDQVTPMLFRKHIVSTRTLFRLTAAVVVLLAGAGVADAANSGITPLLVPYTVNTIAGTPQFGSGTTSVPVGYFGEGVPATPYLLPDGHTVKQGATLNGPFTMAVDSVGNVYIVDTGNLIIREVNAQTGLITTVGGIFPKGCSGVTCTLRVPGCADGVPAAGAAIGSAKMAGIALDAYGNIYFTDQTTQSVSVIYRGGTQVANFIKLVNPAGVTKSGGNVLPGYVYHVAGTVNLQTCSGSSGNLDGAATSGAFEDSSNPPSGLPGAQFKNPGLIHVDSAGNIYVADTGNATVRVINTQATSQTFFQYTVDPGFMRSISNCNASLTTPCPSGTITSTANTGINGPANAVVFQSQYKEAEVDAYGNLYQLNGTGSGTGPPGIYANVVYAGGAPLTNLLITETPTLAAAYPSPPELNSSGLPTYGNAYVGIGNPPLTSTLPTFFADVMATQNQDFDIRPSSLLPDNFGTLWFYDNHYPELHRIDQYSSLGTLFLRSGRATASVTGIYSGPATFTSPWYCVYGASGSSPLPWNQGPQSFDPEGDGCPAIVARFSGGNAVVSDGLGNIFVGDGFENIEREMVVGTTFPATAVGTATPVVQPIQVHFGADNPPVLGAAIPDGPATGYATTSFSIAPGAIPDFAIDTTDPEFPLGSLSSGGGYGNNSKTTNFAMWAGLPTCTQLGAYPVAWSDTSYDCLVYVSFNPTAPGTRQSQLLATTANGSTYYFGLTGVGTGSQLAIDGGGATTVPATGLGTTAGIAVTQSGTIYIADPTNNRVVVENGGTQSSLTFTGVTPASLSGPMGVAVDAAANVYISDTGNNRILKVNPLTGVATVLGNYVWIPGSNCDGGSTTPPPTCPAAGLAGEPGAAVKKTTAPPQYAFNHPQGLAVDASNNVYVADTGNGVVVEIPSNIALGGAVPLLNYYGAPKFSKPVAIAVDSQGNIYVADNQAAGGVIIELPPGGGDLVNLPGTQFQNKLGSGLGSPNGVAVDAAGNVYASDGARNVVIEIPSASGPGSAPFALNFPGLSAPAGLALDANGNLYVADSGNKQVLYDYRQNPTIRFGNVPQNLAAPAQPLCANTIISDGFNIGSTGVGCILTVTNIGTQPVTLTNPITSVVGGANAAYSMTNTCTSPLPAGLTCTISATFVPTASNGQSETVNVNGGPQSFSLTANGAQPLAGIVLSAAYSGGTSTTAPTSGATATITATLTQPFVAGNTPTGTVTFTYTINAANNNANNCGSGGTQTVTVSGGKASFALPTLVQGIQYTVTANYNGDTVSSPTQATPLVVYVPGIQVSATVTSTPAQLTFIYGGAPPAVTGTVSPVPPSPITFKFGSAATATTPIGSYPVILSFSGAGSCSYGFPPSLYANGSPATVTENPAPLLYTIPNFSAQYGAANLSYGANAVVTGAVNGDTFSATFTPAQSSILNVSAPVFTGNTTSGNNVVASVSSTTGLTAGALVSGAGIPDRTSITSIGTGSITLSNNATATASGVVITAAYKVIPTVTGANVGNYTVTAPPSALTITQAPVGISVSAAQTAVLNTTAGVAAATYQISISSAVPSGKGVPSGTVTLMDNFVPITLTAPGTSATVPSCSILFVGATTNGSPTITGVGGTYGLVATTTDSSGKVLTTGQVVTGPGIPAGTTIVSINGSTVTLSAKATANSSAVTLSAASGASTCNAPVVLPVTAGLATYTATNVNPGTHQYTFVYNGDSNFLVAQLAPNVTAPACIPSAITTNCLVVDNPDFTLTSATGPISIIPGDEPCGNGLPIPPFQCTAPLAAPQQTAVLFVNKVLGFVGQVSLSCATQNPSYVSCVMSPQTVCFATTSSSACTNTGASAATVLAVQTPATLPLGFKFTSQLRTSATGTALAFLPLGLLAFCVRKRRRLSKALWMLIAISAVSAGMSGCGGNLVDFYTPVPTGAQTVTVTATYLGNGSNQPAAVRSYVVPININ